ncbi:MAG: DRTGG domain-containing protein [Oscillospiraceae bacterium]|nr:DRTGG domain-containing protein [Oscillospiraceae bacterium]
MKVREVAGILEAEVCCDAGMSDGDISSVCAADIMSDVIIYVREQPVLLTGLLDSQVLHTAEMMDIRCIVFVRGKKPDPSLTEQARAKNITVLTTALSMYIACGKLYAAGLR